MKVPTLMLLALLAAQSAEFPKLVVPNTPDFTIKTRRRFGSPGYGIVEIVYLKGARQRRETIFEPPPQTGATTFITTAPPFASVTQCDERRTMMLNDRAKTYAYSPIEDPTEFAKRVKAAVASPQPEPVSGGDVTITIESVDTGERRQVGSYVARHVITTSTTEPGPGASTSENAVREDGWFIDLPATDCWDTGAALEPFSYLQTGNGLHDRMHVVRRGAGRRGYSIEETTASTSEGRTLTWTVEFVEFSVAPLDAALFTVPPGYEPALPGLYGGYDMTKADTLANRLQSYWQGLTAWANHLFR